MAFTRKIAGRIVAPVVVGLVAACAQTPMGPTVQVMPGPGKSFEAFQYDQAGCKQFAEQSVAGQAQNANMRGLAVGVVGTALGAGLGGAIGGGRGAGIGAASGALGGGALGAGSSANAQYGIQEQYDNAYAQCMYAKGDMVPGYGPMMVNAPAPPPYSSASLTRAVQAQLIRLGYLSGPADGVVGPNTASAISTYERTAGLPMDGVPSEPLLARLQATP
ncbi:MAG TPA: peptidoglycan-binding domain-containing protein [Acetobacteraceae bacterium]|nr:peptidoglycan-binding domain-containing protein [Acetobacteraceae bacterium]